MKIKIKRIDKSLPLPEYGTDGAAALDLYAREKVKIEAKSMGLVPSNIIIRVPEDYAFIVVPRSSTPRRKGLSIPHGIGIIDPDYAGQDDEIKLQFYNFTNDDVIVEKGERVAQGFIVKLDRIQWEEADEISKDSRGGFGSTG